MTESGQSGASFANLFGAILTAALVVMGLFCCIALVVRRPRADADGSKQNLQEVQLSHNRASVQGGRALESEIEMQLEEVP